MGNGETKSLGQVSNELQSLFFIHVMLLISDIWQLIIPLLSPQSIHRLRCSGDRLIIRDLSRRKNGSFDCHQVPSSWPSEVTSDANFQSLNITIRTALTHINPIRYKSFIDIQKMPKMLVTLRLKLYVDSLPFLTYGGHDPADSQAAFAVYLPNLRDLTLLLHNTGGQWLLPNSLTRFEGVGANWVPGCLPPGLIHLKNGGGYAPHGFWSTLPLTLEIVEGGRFDEMTSLPRLAHFRGSYEQGIHPPEFFSSLFPSLTSFEVTYGPYTALAVWLPPNLTFLNLDHHLRRVEITSLPPTLTELKIGTTGQHHFHPLDVPLLPPALRILKLSPFMAKKELPPTVMSNLPSGLVTLEAPWVLITPEQISTLPPTLTELHIHNLCCKGASKLSHLPLLTKLGLYGGTLQANIAKALPRRLSSLTLDQVALRTKGHYQVPGSSEYLRYSAKNPQLSVLKHLPQLLSELFIVARSADDYLKNHRDQVLELLPKTLRTLGLRIATDSVYNHYNYSEEPESSFFYESLDNLPHRPYGMYLVRPELKEGLSKFPNLTYLWLSTSFSVWHKSIPK